MNWLRDLLSGLLVIPTVSVAWDVLGPYVRFANMFLPLEECFQMMTTYIVVRGALLVIRYILKVYAQIPVFGGHG